MTNRLFDEQSERLTEWQNDRMNEWQVGKKKTMEEKNWKVKTEGKERMNEKEN